MDFLTPELLGALVMLTVMEIVLGIDNVIFIAIKVAKLPVERQKSARIIGLSLAMGLRILLLFTLSYLMGLTQPLFEILGHGFSGRDLILISGGIFLLYSATKEIIAKVELHDEGEHGAQSTRESYAAIIGQILVLDIVFSLDSVITAVGMVNNIPIMVAAIVISVGVMMFAAKPVGDFVNKHAGVKILALAFLFLIGVVLVAEGMGNHFPKGYIYSAIVFAFSIEMLNLRRSANKVKMMNLLNKKKD
ncbi:MAG: TerC family protein [Candidatus Obscuribacterales bacterium]|nr:TerC family protein [Candidatus Obscuribacterales bacterium]